MPIFQDLLEVIGQAIVLRGTGTPNVSKTDSCRLWYDVANNQFKISVNGGAYTELPELGASQWTHTNISQIEDLAANADIAARAEFCAPAGGCTLTKVGIVSLGDPAAVDDSNTVVIAIADAAANAIVSKTFNTATQPPDAGIYDDLGSLDATHKVLTGNEVCTLAITQGTNANLDALLVIWEWTPAT